MNAALALTPIRSAKSPTVVDLVPNGYPLERRVAQVAAAAGQPTNGVSTVLAANYRTSCLLQTLSTLLEFMAMSDKLTEVERCLLLARLKTIATKIKEVTIRLPPDCREPMYLTYTEVLKVIKDFTEKYF
jgi:hypothetical protein